MSTTTDLPPGVTDTFTVTCECEATVQIVDGTEQPHDCPLTDEQRQAIRDAAAEAVEKEAEAAIDPLRVAVRLLDEALNELQDAGVSRAQRLAHKIAIAQGFATVSVAMAGRSQYNLEAQLANIQMQDREAMIAAQQQQAEPNASGLVVARLTPQGGV